MSKELSQCQVIERSLFKTYRKRIWVPFIMAIKKYELIQKGDRIAVCISGGKDSMLLAKLLQMLQRHSDFPFELVFLVMDPGYNSINREKIESNAKLLEIPITIFETDIFNIADRTEKILVIFVLKCVEVICTVKLKSLAVIKSHLDTTSTML